MAQATVPPHDFDEMLHSRGIALRVPQVSVLGNNPEQDLFTLPRNHKRRSRPLNGLGTAISVDDIVVLPVKSGLVLREQALDDPARLVERL